MSRTKRPRVLTDDEIRKLPKGAVVWVDQIRSNTLNQTILLDVYPAMIASRGSILVDLYDVTNFKDDPVSWHENGDGCRYWNAKPTKQQREETPWEKL